MRGPAILAQVAGRRTRPTRRQRFDDLVVTVVSEIEDTWADRLGLVEYGVEDAPQLPDDWDSGGVPLASLIRRGGGEATRMVLFRRPIEHRAGSREELEGLVLTVIIEQVAELLGIPPDEVDARYGLGFED